MQVFVHPIINPFLQFSGEMVRTNVRNQMGGNHFKKYMSDEKPLFIHNLSSGLVHEGGNIIP